MSKSIWLLTCCLLAACSDNNDVETPEIVEQPKVEDGAVAQVVINEAVAQNAIFDDFDGDSSDWLEIYNGTDDTINLANWTLTDDSDEPNKWRFPEVSIPAKGFKLVWASDKDAQFSGQYRAFFSHSEPVKYITPTSAIDTSWTAVNFNDNDWPEGQLGIGYGDNDDQTQVDSGVSAVFVRIRFDLSNAQAISQLYLDIDYDDGFVAYLNGTEIARGNMSGIQPAFSAYADTAREATLYAGGLAEKHDVSAFLDRLQEGENVLAIQVHNHSNASSDMSLIPHLTGYVEADNASVIGFEPEPKLNYFQDELHTNFKISFTTPESLYLLNSNGDLVHSLAVPQHSLNGSVGLNAEGEAVFFATPTPNKMNTAPGFSRVNLSPPNFSHAGGIVSPMSLTLSGATDDQEVRYTTDSTEPNASSPLYTAPIAIDSSTVIRAAIFADDAISSPINTGVYLVNKTHELPIITLTTAPDNLWDHHSGIYVLGPNAHNNLPFFDANFWQDWEKPMDLQIFDEQNQTIVKMAVGAKIFGGWSRANEQRSFSLFARGRYGESAITAPLFDALDYQSFQSLVVRNSGQDWLKTGFKDLALTRLMAGSGIDVQAGRPSVVYLNGEYWGLYNLREKVNEHFLASKHQVSPEEIDMVEANGVLVHGDHREFEQLMSFVANNNLTVEDHYQTVAAQIDIDNFIRYQVAQIYFDNHDWPGNNIKMWRPKSGKWRWIMYDTDFSFNTWPDWHEVNSFDSLSFATEPNGPGWPNPPWSTLLLRKLLANESFKTRFINQFADELNSRFLPQHVVAHIDQHADVISSEIPAHLNKWAGSSNTQSWQVAVDDMKAFGQARPAYMKQHIINYFNLAASHHVTLTNQVNNATIKVNSLDVTSASWRGEYFSDVPVELRITNDGVDGDIGARFSHWDVNGVSYPTPTIKLTLTRDTSIVAIANE